jgi:hypothetical protein
MILSEPDVKSEALNALSCIQSTIHHTYGSGSLSLLRALHVGLRERALLWPCLNRPNGAVV